MGLVEFADMLGIKDPGELLRVAELRQRAAKYVLLLLLSCVVCVGGGGWEDRGWD